MTVEQRSDTMDERDTMIEQIEDKKISLDWLGLSHLTETAREVFSGIADKDNGESINYEALSREFVESLNERGYVVARAEEYEFKPVPHALDS